MPASRKDQPGKLDAAAVCEEYVEVLLAAVRKGGRIHRTKNIRDSGGALETAFRDFLAKRLPAPFGVRSGYLVGSGGDCTPQIDAMVVDPELAIEVDATEEGAVYLQFPCARVLIEVKNSATEFAKHVGQIRKVEAAFSGMRAEARARGQNVDALVHPPLTILIIGDTKGLAPTTAAGLFADDPEAPRYTLLLDRGLLIARRHGTEGIFVTDGRDGASKPFALEYFAHRGPSSEWCVWEPEALQNRKGAALLWLNQAIVAHLSLMIRGDQLGVRRYPLEVARDFPMVMRSPLSTATQW